MDLKQLRSFLMVAECGSLSAASDRLRLAQPALSRQIRLLEAEIGFALFTRSTRGMVPTVRGAALFARVSGLVRQIDDSIDDIRWHCQVIFTWCVAVCVKPVTRSSRGHSRPRG